MNWLKTKYFVFFVKKEELSDEFSSSHVADSSSIFAYLDYIMNFLKVNVRDLAKAGQKKNLFPPLSWNNLYIKFYFRCSIY